MPVTNYHTIDGEILGETTNGVRTDYLKDALGSVTGTTIAGVVQNTYRYKPYGGLLAKTGTAADPKFQWVGSEGVEATGRAHAEHRFKPLTYSDGEGAWDSLPKRGWLSSGPYAAGLQRPVSVIGLVWRPDEPGSNWTDWQASATPAALQPCTDAQHVCTALKTQACPKGCWATIKPHQPKQCCDSPRCSDPKLGVTNICCPRTACSIWYCYDSSGAACAPPALREQAGTPSDTGFVCQLDSKSGNWHCIKGSR